MSKKILRRDMKFLHCLVLRVRGVLKITGGDSEEGPPVPIPNTAVKLLSAEDTCWATDRENRTLPVLTESEALASLYSQF